MAFTLRFDAATINELDEMAERHGMNRKEILTHMVKQALQQGVIPRKAGEGLAFSSNGGNGLRAIVGDDVIVDTNDLTAEEIQVVKQAQESGTTQPMGRCQTMAKHRLAFLWRLSNDPGVMIGVLLWLSKLLSGMQKVV